MIEFLLVCTVITWCVMQFYGEREKKWRRRGRAVLPVLNMLTEDARATVIYFWRTPERARDWRELRRLERS